jgi:serine/threonine protein kinase
MGEDIPPDLQGALGQRYDLRRVLGRGGMATVYLAADSKHHREVALKVLLPGLAAFLGTERFLKEIEIAARLNHPHILALYDSGEAGGHLYYVMPYVDGGSLRQSMSSRGVSIEGALGVARPVADALAYAHRMGVLHRDIKPENILFLQGHPVVADFGIAKAVSTAGGASLTRTGFPIGTPGYMSPEQAAGLTDLDARTDVYSLAVVVYEMLVGELPGRWPTEEAVRVGRFLDAPAGHRATLAAAGNRVEAALVRGLATRHDQRTATPDDLIADLSGTLAVQRRRYSGDEVQEIVRRASELEAARPTAGAAMTIGGVEALAADVGIEPSLVRAAADSLRQREPPTPGSIQYNRWIGGPTTLYVERVIDGEVPDAEFPTMVEEIRRELRNPGQVSQLGRSFSWLATRGASTRRDLEVAVTVRGGRTRITIREHLGNLIGGMYGGIGGGMGGGGLGPIMGILGGVLHLAPVAFAFIVPVWLVGTFATARGFYRYHSLKRAREVDALADRLAELARELVPGRPALPHRLPHGTPS